MDDSVYDLDKYIADLRMITVEENDPRRIVQRVRPLAAKLATTPGWLRPEHRRCDPDQGFGVHLLHEEEDHGNAVFVLAWLPGRGTLPHNHKTWAVVAGIEGVEREIMWRRLDDGSQPGVARLEPDTEALVTRGKVSCLMPDDIHSVRNEGQEISLSLHTYGRHINHTGRSEFDPEQNLERPFVVTVEA